MPMPHPQYGYVPMYPTGYPMVYPNMVMQNPQKAPAGTSLDHLRGVVNNNGKGVGSKPAEHMKTKD
ncbi:histone-lysine N-methyltransferase SETD1 [Sesbania bispinosa]|nr:histone-lysine N-methyltransferase SETD1 [Sesbania bispinosa]